MHHYDDCTQVIIVPAAFPIPASRLYNNHKGIRHMNVRHVPNVTGKAWNPRLRNKKVPVSTIKNSKQDTGQVLEAANMHIVNWDCVGNI